MRSTPAQCAAGPPKHNVSGHSRGTGRDRR